MEKCFQQIAKKDFPEKGDGQRGRKRDWRGHRRSVNGLRRSGDDHRCSGGSRQGPCGKNPSSRRAGSILLDVRDEDQWSAAITHTIQTFGGLDFVVNNAGVELLGLVEDTDFDKWCWLQDINSDGVFLGTKHAIRAMKPGGAAGKGGAIVNMSSVGGLVGSYVTSAYNASKGLVRTFTKAAAIECGNLQYGIPVNSVHPGMIRTSMIDEDSNVL